MIVRVHYEVGQTALSIVCDESYLSTVKGAVHSARSLIEGKIAEEGTPEELFGNPQNPRTQQFLQSVL